MIKKILELLHGSLELDSLHWLQQGKALNYANLF